MDDQDKPAAQPRAGNRGVRGNMTGFPRQAGNGASPTTSHGEAAAGLHQPPLQAQPARQPGGLQVWMAPDFDELPADMLNIIEDKE